MRYKTFLQELQNFSPTLDIEHIQEWLIKHKNEFHNTIKSTTCRKWNKWLNTNEKPFPCACSFREQDCIFIEAYYKLNNALVLYKQQQYLMDLVPQYESIKNNKAELKAFTTNLNTLGLNLSFESQITISLNTDPYEKIIFQLNEKEFEGIIKFKEIYQTQKSLIN